MNTSASTLFDVEEFVRDKSMPNHTTTGDLSRVFRFGGWAVATDGHVIVAAFENGGTHIDRPAPHPVMEAMVRDILSPRMSTPWDALPQVDEGQLRRVLRATRREQAIRLRPGPIINGAPTLEVCGKGWAARIVAKRDGVDS